MRLPCFTKHHNIIFVKSYNLYKRQSTSAFINLSSTMQNQSKKRKKIVCGHCLTKTLLRAHFFICLGKKRIYYNINSQILNIFNINCLMCINICVFKEPKALLQHSIEWIESDIIASYYL
jgi:hypothetical protein